MPRQHLLILGLLLSSIPLVTGCQSSPELSSTTVRQLPSSDDATAATHSIEFVLRNRTLRTYWAYRSGPGPAYCWTDVSTDPMERWPGDICGTGYFPKPLRPGASWRFEHWVDAHQHVQVAVMLYPDRDSAESDTNGVELLSDPILVTQAADHTTGKARDGHEAAGAVE